MLKKILIGQCLAVLLLTLLACGCGEPKSVDYYLAAGASQAEAGNWKEALKSAKRALKQDSTNTSALLFAALCHERRGERDRAWDCANRAVALNPESFPAQYTLGRLYASEPSRYSDAVKPLTKAAKLSAYQDGNTLKLLTVTSVRLRSPAAANWLQMLIRRDPEFAKSAQYCNLLALIQVNRGDYARARGSFAAAYARDKSSPVLLYNIGRFFDRCDKNAAASKKFYTEFLRVAPDNAEFAPLRREAALSLNPAP